MKTLAHGIVLSWLKRAAPAKEEEPVEDVSEDTDTEEQPSEENTLQEGIQKELAQLHVFYSIAINLDKRLNALKLKKQPTLAIDFDPEDRILRISSKTIRDEETYLILMGESGQIMVQNRDFSDFGLLGSSRPYEGEAIAPTMFDELTSTFYELWTSRQVNLPNR